MDMEGWLTWKGKKVFIILKNRRQYSGEVVDVDISATPLIFITLIDKFGERVTFVHSELELIQEEGIK